MTRKSPKTTKTANTTRTDEDKAMKTKPSKKTSRTEMTIEMVQTLKGDELLQAHELVLGTAAKPKTPAPVLRSRIIAELERRAAAEQPEAIEPAAPDAATTDEPEVIEPAAPDAAEEPEAIEPAAPAEDASPATPNADPEAPAVEPATTAPDADASATAGQDGAHAAESVASAAPRDAIDMLIDRARTMDSATLEAFLAATPKKELHTTVERLTGQKTSGRLTPASAIARIKEALTAPATPATEGSAPAEAAAQGDGAAPASDASDAGAGTPPDEAHKDQGERQLPSIGTEIHKRDRHGAIRATCKVVEGGIEYGGKVLGSLSAAAIAAARDLGLTTKTLNGWVWWGLADLPRVTRTGAPKALDLEALEKAWDRFRERAEAAMKGATGDDAAKLRATLLGHAEAIFALAQPAPANADAPAADATATDGPEAA